MSPARAKPSAPRKIGADNDNKPGEGLAANDAARPRLKANPRMIGAVAKRQLEGLIAATRARLEADPAPSLSRELNRAERLLTVDQDARACGETLATINETLDERAEARKVEAVLAEQDALLAARGIETVPGVKVAENDRIPTGDKASTRDGFLWLIRKGRVTGTRRMTGLRYQRFHGLAMTDGLSSSGNDNSPVSESDPPDPIEVRIAARQRLEAVKAAVWAATGSHELADLLEAVCGRGETLRSMARSDRDAAIMEGQLLTALDMAGVTLGTVKV